MDNDELAQHLNALKREDCYRVDAVLKQSVHETTQRVFFVGENGTETGPYIRKFIQQTPGMGAAYERIFAAQQQGRRFKHLPGILECYSRDGSLVVVMEYVRGETLQDAVYRKDPSVELAADIFPQLCDAVGELHDEFDPAIIHRDLKPSNIILSSGGLAIIDFGIAREFKSDSDSDTSHFGTRGFAPPEQFGFGQTTVRSDIYSLGMVLYYCLTESIPDNAMRERGFADPHIPNSIRQVIIKAAAFDPQYRFASATELKRAFLSAVERAEQESADEKNAGGRDDGRVTAGAYAHARDGAGRDVSGAAESNAAAPMDGGTLGARKNRRPLAIVAAALAACVVVAMVFAIGMGAHPQSTTATSSASASSATHRADGEGSAQSSVSASSAESTANESEVVEQAATAVSIDAPKKNAFDPATNFKATIAGVDFQIPRYFQTKTQSNGSMQYYYAETGSSTAMLMTSESAIDGTTGDIDIYQLYDDYLDGVMKSNDTFGNLAIVADCDLAGYPARIATFNGVIAGSPVKMEIAFFYNPSQNVMGSLLFGQTENAQFDYRDDVAQAITSATPATT